MSTFQKYFQTLLFEMPASEFKSSAASFILSQMR